MTVTHTDRVSVNVPGHVLNSTAPHAARIGDYVVSSSVNGRDVLDGDDVVDLRPQVQAAFSKLQEVLAEAGAGLDDLALLVINIADEAGVEDAVLTEWKRTFPQGRGPVTQLLVPRGGFPKPNTYLGIQFVAKVGGQRQALALDGEQQIGSFPHAVRIDDLVVVAPVSTDNPSPTAATDVFDTVRGRLDAVGATPADVGQLRLYAQDTAAQKASLDAFTATFGSLNGPQAPAVTTLVTPDAPAALHVGPIIAVVSDTREGFVLTDTSRETAGVDVARRGNLFFSSGFHGTSATADDDNGETQLENLYERLQALASAPGASAGLGRLLKVNMWIDDKSAKDRALIGWRDLFGTKEEGAREKTPARTFLIQHEPSTQPGTLVEMEFIGVSDTRR